LSNPNTKSSDTDVLTAGDGRDSQQPSSLERAGDGGKPLSPEEKAVDEAFREVFGDPETMKPPQDDFEFAENGTELVQAEQSSDAGDRLFDEMAEYVHQGNRIEQAQEEIQGGVRLPKNDVGTRHSAVGDLYGSAAQRAGNSAINTTEGGASSSAAEVNPQKNSAASTTKDIDPQNSTAIDAGNWTENEVGTNKTKEKKQQVHHFATNKNGTYTKMFGAIVERYGLKLDEEWNKELLPHQGRHPNAYHEFVLEKLREIDNQTEGDVRQFKLLFEQEVRRVVRDNPDMLYSRYWRKLKQGGN